MLFDKKKVLLCYRTEDGESHELPYSRSLFKIRHVEYRNLLLVIQDLLKPDCCPDLDIGTKLKLVQKSLSSDKSESWSLIYDCILLPSMKPKPIGMHLPTESEDDRMIEIEDDPQAPNVHEKIDYAPPNSSDQYISMMKEETSLCLRVLDLIKLHSVTTARSYDTVIQSAVKFYRPDLAWKYYEEMRAEGWHPNQDTVSDLIYSITHDMRADDFIEIGAETKIKTILEDITTNPEASLNDGIFLNLFYGVHIVPDLTNVEENHISPDLIDAIDKYNFNIFSEMSACMKNGMFKLRFSTASKILTLNNLQRIGDTPKSGGKIDINNAMYDLFNENADLFIRDYENDESTSFMPLLLNYARDFHPVYDIDKFYITHLKDLKTTSDLYEIGSSDIVMHQNHLHNILTYDLTANRGVAHPIGTYSSLKEIRPVTCFTMYNDFFKNRLGTITFRLGISMMVKHVRMVQCLNPFTTDISYMLGLYKYIIQESILITAESRKVDDWNAELYAFLQDFFDKFHVDYLMKFSLASTASSSSFHSKKQLKNAQKMVLSEKNILDIIKMTSDAISLLLKNGGMPTSVMMYILVSHTLKSGEYTEAWKLLNLYDQYSIPLDGPAILKFIELTRDWKKNSEHYLGVLEEPLQGRVRHQVVMLEKKYKQDITTLARLQRYHVPFRSGPENIFTRKNSDFSETGIHKHRLGDLES